MTALDWLAVGCTVAACAALAWADPAERVQRWWRRRKDAQAPGDVGHATQVQRGGEGAAPAVVAPSPVTEPIFFEACLPKREVVRINAQLAWQPAQHGMRAEA